MFSYGSGSGNVAVYERIVKSASELTGDLRSDTLYKIDGAIDLGAGSITVPQGGLQIEGHGVTISSLTSTGSIFVTGTEPYSGDLFVRGLTFTSPSVFNLNNAGNLGAVECIDTNFTNCASLGELTAYRQGLWTNVALIFCTAGLTLSGTWAGGFFSTTAIVIGAMTGPVFKEGTALVINGSFRSDFNALQLGGAVFTDIAAADIANDAAFSMEGVRVPGGYDAFPNMPSESVKARFRNCQGVRNTYVGGQWSVTTPATTTLSGGTNPNKLAGVTTYSDLQWFTGANDNEFVYISTQDVEVQVLALLTLSGNNNDQVSLIVRQWDDSASGYIDLATSGARTLNSAGRAEGVEIFAFGQLEENDRIEIWIENTTANRDVTAAVGGIVGVSER